jgi:hypothetical protein
MRILPLLLLALALPGCKLIDQRTFRPDPVLPDTTNLASAIAPERRIPLVTIRYDTPDPDYGTTVGQAVRAVEAAKPETSYDIVAAVPQRLDQSAQAEETATGNDDAAGVMRALMEDGIPAARLHLALRVDPALSVREVRIYLE